MTSPASPTNAVPDRGSISPRLAWATVAFLWFAYLLNYTDRQVIFSIFPVLRKELGFTDTQLGLLGTLFIWVYSLCMPLTGRLADVFRRDRLVISSLVLWSLATLGTGLSTSVAGLMFWRAVMGVTESLYVPAALATIAVLHPGVTRSKALAIHGSAQYAGIVVGGWYGGWSADHIGWRPGFVLLAFAGAAYAIALWKRFPATRISTVHAHRAATPKDVFQSPCYWTLALAFFAFCTMLWMLYAWFPNFIYEHYHLSMTASGFTATVYLQTSCVAGVLSGGVLADWLVARVRSGRFLVAVAGLAGCAPFAFLCLASGSLAVAKLSAAGFGFFAGLFTANIFAASYDVTSRQNYGLGAGILNMIGGVAGGAAILTTGVWKASLGMAVLMQWQAIASAAGAILLLFVVLARFSRDHRRALAGEPA
ncbi:MAG TPA: MFS transporter [Bryobacteraceae bacterium]|nr:MFS transporter [Bryobacteraceae bacterium]